MTTESATIVITDAPSDGADASPPADERDDGRGEAIPIRPPALEDDGEVPSRVSAEGDAGIASPLPCGAPSGSLGAIVGNVKSITARRINRMKHTPGGRVWQRNYWEHIIRDERAYQCIRRYIEDNPALWAEDQLHPHAPPNPFNRGRCP